MKKIVIVVFLLVALPLIPFILWNEAIESAVVTWAEAHNGNAFMVSATTILLLTVDLFLPIPSSVVSVFTTRILSSCIVPHWLGLCLGIFVIWLGMTTGALLAWLIGKWGGQPLARKFVGDEDFCMMQILAQRYGARVLVILRAVPLFAESSVLLMAISNVPFMRVFFWPVALSNAGIAIIYGLLGNADNEIPLPLMFLASILLPATVSLIANTLVNNITH